MEQNVVQKAPEQAKKSTPNLTGIPTQMKLDFERRSGLSFDDVRVHYNSDKPRKIGALAYTQIPQVHIGPGQERHLRHELGHVVQQKRGIVRPTSLQGGQQINESTELERSADNILDCSIINGSRTIKHGSAIIQKKGVNVSVSLIPHESKDKEYAADEVLFQHLSLYGRSETALDSQGDHTVADILIKKSQKEAVTGHTITNAINIYKQMNDNLNAIFQAFVQTRPDDPIGKVSATEKGIVSALKLLSTAAGSKRIMEANKHREALEQLFAAKQLQAKNKLTFWTALLKNIIYEYNEYYASSPFATFGVGTGGHGEASAIREAKQWRDDILHQQGYATPITVEPDIEQVRKTAKLARLYDYDSAWIVSTLLPLRMTIDAAFLKKCEYILDGIGASGTNERDVRLLSEIEGIVKQTNKDCSIPLAYFVDHLYLVLSSKDITSNPLLAGAVDFRRQQKIASSTLLQLIPYKERLVANRYLDDVESTASTPAAVPASSTTMPTKSAQSHMMSELRPKIYVKPDQLQVGSYAPPKKRARTVSASQVTAAELRTSRKKYTGKPYVPSSIPVDSKQRYILLVNILRKHKINPSRYFMSLLKIIKTAYPVKSKKGTKRK